MQAQEVRLNRGGMAGKCDMKRAAVAAARRQVLQALQAATDRCAQSPADADNRYAVLVQQLSL